MVRVFLLKIKFGGQTLFESERVTRVRLERRKRETKISVEIKFEYNWNICFAPLALEANSRNALRLRAIRFFKKKSRNSLLFSQPEYAQINFGHIFIPLILFLRRAFVSRNVRVNVLV